MKRTIAIILLALCAYFYTMAQDTTMVSAIDTTMVKKSILSPKDSIFIDYAYYIADNLENIATHNHPRFKLYQTENIYNLIKLDTATGAIWQVQYEMNKSSDAMEVPINETSLVWGESQLHPGRFELYPTKNMYTFILLDTERGYTYQVQWSTKPKQRFRVRIY